MKTRSDKLVAPGPDQFLGALRERLTYDPLTGAFAFRKTGKRAGCLDKSTGYVRIRLWNVLYHAHRLAWVYVHGVWPEAEVDHRSRARDDNALRNLRPATSGQNKCNARRPVHNTSGFKGVSFDKSRGLWRATIKVKGRWRQIGRYPTRQAAAQAYRQQAVKLQGPFCPLSALREGSQG